MPGSQRALCFILILLFPLGQVFSQSLNQHGIVTGEIHDEQNNSLASVSVTVQETGQSTVSDLKGNFRITVRPGNYTIILSSSGFQTKKVSEVVVTENKETNLSITMLLKTNSTLGEVIVSSTAKKESSASLLRAQKNNISMTDGISADQMRATPDLNIGQSLVRVSGVNVQSGKFVTIRGVSDRYNNVLINGSSLPSTEPNRRNFSFDIVPSSLVDNVVVNKTASPDLPGEFTGGLVQINTKDVPSKNFLEIGIGTGFNNASINKEFIGFERDRKASIGKIDNERLWFGKNRAFNAFKFFVDTNNADTAALRATSKKIPNRWKYYSYEYRPMLNYQLTGGLMKALKENRSIGIVGAITYLNEQFLEQGEARSISNYDYQSKRYKYNTTIGALLNTAFKTRKNKISWKNLYNLKYTNQVDDREGLNISQSSDQRRFADITYQTKLYQTRLEGDHSISWKNIRVDWYADMINLDREQPDARYLTSLTPRYSFEFTQLPLTNGGIFASQFGEKRNNAGVNLNLPFNALKEKHKIKAGFNYSTRTAEYENTGLRILTPNLNKLEGVGYLPYHLLVTEANFENGNLYYKPAYSSNFSTGDKYKGVQDLSGIYLMADLKPFNKLRITGGIRNEINKMAVTTGKFVFNSSESQLEDTIARYKETDWLPSTNIIYSLTSKINIRGSFSRTLARPDFVERSYIQYYDFADQLVVYGDVGLKVTSVKNFDLRFEYYPAGSEIISVSFFHKDFKNPVERFYEIDNPSNSVQYRNLPKASARGFEIDVKKGMGFISDRIGILQKFFIQGNFTYLEGKLTSAQMARQKRPIQGLAPYIINSGLSYQDKFWGLNLVFNRSGRKIVNAGNREELIQFENPRSVLDLQLNTKLLKQKLEIRLNLGDLLNQPYIIYSNGNKTDGVAYDDPKGSALNKDSDFINYKVKKGTNFSLNAVYKF